MAWPFRLVIPGSNHEQRRRSRALSAGLASSSLREWQACSSSTAEPTKLERIWMTGEPAEAESETAASAATEPAALQLLFPCALRPAASPKGIDLQLRLFQLQLGSPAEPSSSGGSSSHVLRRRAAPHQQRAAPPLRSHPLLGVLDKAAGLLAARLLFPDAALPVVRLLAAAHCASAAVQVSSLLLSPAARAARHRLRLQSAGPLASAAARGARRLGSVLQCYGEPAFVLLALAVLWARVHPSSQQIGECLAGALLGSCACA